jgi:hypothetical protein
VFRVPLTANPFLAISMGVAVLADAMSELNGG